LAHLALEQPVQAEKVLRQALAKAPDDPEVVMHLGRALMALGREEEAQAFMEKYQKIRPQGLPIVRKPFGMIKLATLTVPEQRGHQIERFRRDAREHPERPDYQLHLASLLLADSQKEEAIREGKRAVELLPESKDAFDGPQVTIALAQIYCWTGEKEQALQLIERSLATPNGINVPLLKLDPVWDPIRDDPRFKALIDKYGHAT